MASGGLGRARPGPSERQGELSAKLFSQLDDEYEQRRSHAERARDHLRDFLSSIEGSTPTADIDAILDRLSAARQIISGVLDADTTPALNARLHDLFSHMTVEVTEQGVVVTLTSATRGR